MKYKVGDKVRIVKDKSAGGAWNSEGKMDKWLGKVMTIKNIYAVDKCKMEEDSSEWLNNGWNWHEKMIEGLASEVEQNFKVGDKVKLTEGHWFGKASELFEVMGDDKSGSCSLSVRSLNKSSDYYNHAVWVFPKWFELVEKTLNNLEVGDIISNSYRIFPSCNRKVLAVVGEVVAVSYLNNHSMFWTWETIEELKEAGYTIKQVKEIEVKELTLDEIAEKFEVSVGGLKIKKD